MLFFVNGGASYPKVFRCVPNQHQVPNSTLMVPTVWLIGLNSQVYVSNFGYRLGTDRLD